MASGTSQLSTRRLFTDCTHTWHSRSNIGIQRVVRDLAAYGRGAIAGVECEARALPTGP